MLELSGALSHKNTAVPGPKMPLHSRLGITLSLPLVRRGRKLALSEEILQVSATCVVSDLVSDMHSASTWMHGMWHSLVACNARRKPCRRS